MNEYDGFLLVVGLVAGSLLTAIKDCYIYGWGRRDGFEFAERLYHSTNHVATGTPAATVGSGESQTSQPAEQLTDAQFNARNHTA